MNTQESIQSMRDTFNFQYHLNALIVERLQSAIPDFYEEYKQLALEQIKQMALEQIKQMEC